MNISYCSDYTEMSRLAAALVLEALSHKPELLLCAATGSSPEGLYAHLAALARENKAAFRQMRILKLDEWGGLPEMHPVSCEHYLRKKLLDPLDIPTEHYISFRSDPPDPEEECRSIAKRLASQGPIDLCILGLGRNGHLGLNEPAEELQAHCHVADLSPESLGHHMLSSLESKPAYGLTLGMEDILDSRQIIMLVSGSDKKAIAEAFLKARVSRQLPASLLWKHGRTACLVDKTVLD
jgi:galactosamine-6-phosphate isomerase